MLAAPRISPQFSYLTLFKKFNHKAHFDPIRVRNIHCSFVSCQMAVDPPILWSYTRGQTTAENLQRFYELNFLQRSSMNFHTSFLKLPTRFLKINWKHFQNHCKNKLLAIHPCVRTYQFLFQNPKSKGCMFLILTSLVIIFGTKIQTFIL